MHTMLTYAAVDAPPTLVYLEKNPEECPLREGTLRRAAYDFGGGSFRVVVADIDEQTKKIEKLFNAKIEIGFRQELSHGTHFSERTQEVAFDALRRLQESVVRYQPEQQAAIATEAFRMADNGEDMLNTLSEAYNLPITIIPQTEEGRLGFLSGVADSPVDAADTVVLDIGTGSVQITELEETFGLKMGYRAINEMIAKERGLDVVPANINPVTQSEAKIVIDALKNKFAEMPEGSLKDKLNSKTVQVIGTFSPLGNIKVLTVEESAHIQQEETIDFQGAQTGRCLLCCALVDHFDFAALTITGNDSKEGNTLGVFMSDGYWLN